MPRRGSESCCERCSAGRAARLLAALDLAAIAAVRLLIECAEQAYAATVYRMTFRRSAGRTAQTFRPRCCWNSVSAMPRPCWPPYLVNVVVRTPWHPGALTQRLMFVAEGRQQSAARTGAGNSVIIQGSSHAILSKRLMRSLLMTAGQAVHESWAGEPCRGCRSRASLEPCRRTSGASAASLVKSRKSQVSPPPPRNRFRRRRSHYGHSASRGGGRDGPGLDIQARAEPVMTQQATGVRH